MNQNRGGRVHFVGIGGTGLSAIARVLVERGWEVSGSDRQASPRTAMLERLGVAVTIGHAPEAARRAEVVVRSSAVPDDDADVRAARQAGVPVLKRREFLPRLTAGYRVLAVAGSHGKTTTTAMLAWVLTALGHDPTFIIGSEARNLETNAHAGRDDFFVIEADEYDHMFLGLTPYAAVVTNIEHDHPDMFPTAEDFYAAFRRFARQVREDGFLLACADHAGSRRLAAEHRGAVWTYGLEAPDADYRAAEVRLNAGGGYDFVFLPPQGEQVPVALAVPGRHNVANALAVLAVVHRLGLEVAAAAQALAGFRSTGRRFEVVGEGGGVVFVDDYAHHPTEIRATLAAARERFPGHAVWAVWQPHTYSRTLALLPRFATAFDDADAVVVTDVFAAREAPPEGFDPRGVAAALRHPQVHFAATLEAAAEILLTQVQPPAVVVVLSAGDAPAVTRWALEGWQKR